MLISWFSWGAGKKDFHERFKVQVSLSKYLIVRYHKDPIVEVDIGIGSKNLKLGLKNTKIEN